MFIFQAFRGLLGEIKCFCFFRFKIIKRRCPYCDKYMSDLTGHLKLKLPDEKYVAYALTQDQVTRNRIFSRIRNLGMEKTNRLECTKENPNFGRKRSSTSSKRKTVMCSNCKTVLLSKNLARHKRSCTDAVQIKGVEVFSLNLEDFTDEFKTRVLGTLRNDAIGIACRKDHGVLLFGLYRFNRIKRKLDKAMEIRTSVRNEMRRLTTLYMIFKALKAPIQRYFNVVDMFNKENFACLKSAVSQMTTKEGSEIKLVSVTV